MHPRALLTIVAASVVMSTKTACAPSSGIQITVTLGPTCPVQRLGENCERPYAASIDVYSGSGQFEMTTHTGKDGRARVALSPGEYVLRPQLADPARGYPRANPMTIMVRPGEFSSANIQYDTGIR
jgi:hypothetical protein